MGFIETIIINHIIVPMILFFGGMYIGKEFMTKYKPTKTAEIISDKMYENKEFDYNEEDYKL